MPPNPRRAEENRDLREEREKPHEAKRQGNPVSDCSGRKRPSPLKKKAFRKTEEKIERLATLNDSSATPSPSSSLLWRWGCGD
jgi:hypothetical protein